MMFEQMFRNMQSGAQGNFYGGKGRVGLDEKYFRRIDRFEGDVLKYKGWCFNYHKIELPAYIKLPAVYVPTYHKHGYNSQPIPKGSNV